MIFIVFIPIFILTSFSAINPVGLNSVDEFVSQWRAPLSRKIRELSENYVARRNGNQIIFSSHKDTTCAYRKINAKSALARASFYSKIENIGKLQKLTENTLYIGCWGNIELRELITTKGTKLKAITFDQFRKGYRTFELEDNETERYYKIQDGDSHEIFGLRIFRKKQNLHYIYSITGKNFLRIDLLRDKDLQFRAEITGYSFALNYVKRWQSWHHNEHEPTQKWSIFYSETNPFQNIYLDNERHRVSQKEFQLFVGEHLLEHPFKFLREMIGYHLLGYPKTSFTSSGVASSKFLDELRLAYVRLLGGTELALVKNQLRLHIELIEQGKIVIDDRRPNN
ncbi:hypothetical protein OAB57_02025 [Bacteriovoracaceae bacterium]|nr:hypothetical protein [Bacteriovoracaceae bacterium]